jgi:transcriptional regulator with XRE-family HTH domain
MAERRRRLVERRKTLGYSQETLAEDLGVDRSTVARWERNETDPQPFVRPKLARLLEVTPRELTALLTTTPAVQPPLVVIPPKAPSAPQRLDAGEDDDMNRRELLQLLTTAGALVAMPRFDSGETRPVPEAVDDYEQLNTHLWQAFSLSKSKRAVYPLVRQQLGLLTTVLERPHNTATHQRLCLLAGDLFQLAGEIYFDGNRYTDAGYCYTLAASASKEAEAYDLWACALTRHAFIGMYERRFAQAVPMLSVASQVASRGDSQLSTRYWVAQVQAQALAGLGDFDGCNRALDEAQAVASLSGLVHNGGWLRFDGSRLAEERGTCYVELGRPDLAEAALVDALGQKLSGRRRGSVLTDLAMLGVQRSDPDQVMHYASAALELAEETSSGYVGRKLSGLQAHLTPFASDDRIRELSHSISALVRLPVSKTPERARTDD